MPYYETQPCSKDGCEGTLVYEDDEYSGLAGGGDYEIWRCDTCKKSTYIELPD